MRWKEPAQSLTSEWASALFCQDLSAIGVLGTSPLEGGGTTRIRFPLEENGMPTVWREGALS